MNDLIIKEIEAKKEYTDVYINQYDICTGLNSFGIRVIIPVLSYLNV